MKKTIAITTASLALWTAGCAHEAAAEASGWRRIAMAENASLTVRMEGGQGVHLAADLSNVAEEGETIHRVLRDDGGKVLFAYDVVLRRSKTPRGYTLALLPSQQKPSFNSKREVTAVADEDLVRVELMERAETHEKIVDVYRVTASTEPVVRKWNLREMHDRLFRWVHGS